METVLAYPPDVERVVALKTVGDAASRAEFLAAVREYGKDGVEFTNERLQYLMAIEEHFQSLVLYDQIEFLRSPPPITEPEREFALSIQRICLEAANGFQRFLRNRGTWATTPEAIDDMYRVTGLALNAIHNFVKWGYFLAESGRAAPWKQLHALYLLADHDGYAQIPFVLHPTLPSFKPSVQALYLRTLILDLLNTGSLSKIQVEIADGWFSSWCNDYSLETEYSSRRHLFFVDVGSDSGMHLVRRDSLGENMRYMRADSLKAQIEEVQAGLRHGRLFAGYGAGGVFPVEQHVALLAIIEKLYQSILAGSENRIEERTQFEDREVDVVVGIDLVMKKVREGPVRPAAAAPAAAAHGASVSETIEITPSGLSMLPAEPAAAAVPAQEAPPADPDIERWRVQDLSSKGYGLLVDRAASDAVMLNGVIGLLNHETGTWIVGSVVRKQANRMRGEALVGVEVLSFQPIAVDLAPAKGGNAVEALYCPGVDTNGKQDAIVVRAGEFASDSGYLVKAGGSTYQVRMNRIIKKGADWIRARFEIESKKS
ncbi:MAG TPA: hypothetical protein VFU92_02615 [Usitatibacter sp.]|nr:hypothetical protein [Usitatibacter sp.]